LLAAFKMPTPDYSSPVLPSVGQGPAAEDKGKEQKVANLRGTSNFEPSPEERMDFGNTEDTCDKKEPKEPSRFKRFKRFIIKRVLAPACVRVIIIFNLFFI
jgi:hypothetical protein